MQVPERWTKHPAGAMERNFRLRAPAKASKDARRWGILNNDLEYVQKRELQFSSKKVHHHEHIYY